MIYDEFINSLSVDSSACKVTIMNLCSTNICLLFTFTLFIRCADSLSIIKDNTLHPNEHRYTRSIGFHGYYYNTTDESFSLDNSSGPREEAAIIVVPSRYSRCKPGQLLDRRGKCRTPW